MPNPPPFLPWLSSLKTAHLKAIARATGTPNTGRKDVLCSRISSEIAKSVFLCNKTQGIKNNEMRVLSIDMGIQNLAFAHLRVRRPDDVDKRQMEVVLDAWHRIGVQRLSSVVDDDSAAGGYSDHKELPSSAFRTLTRKAVGQRQSKKKNGNQVENENVVGEETSSSETKDEEEDDRNFEPETLANNAYTLISGLISQYNPTHILIERQRFRSAGQSAVLEWSLRVGVFEGMLHAVLCTMRRLGGFDGRVWDVSPARVAQYWESSSSGSNGDDDDDAVVVEKKKKTERNIKKMKINLVGEWLSQASSSSSSPSESTTEKTEVNPLAKIILPSASTNPEDVDVHATVTAYLERWSGKRSSATLWRVEKLDDLADCLLQGLTWLEWHVRRAQLARDGLEEVGRMGVSVEEKHKEKKGKREKKKNVDS